MDNIEKIFGYTGDSRVTSGESSGGYTKIQDGESVRLRCTLNFYRYFTVQPEGEKMPLQNKHLRDLLRNRTIDDLFEDQTMKISERFCAIVWNHSTKQAEVWQMAKQTFKNLGATARDTEWEGGLVENDIKVTRSGSGTDTTYSISYCKTSEPLKVEQEAQLLDISVDQMVAGAIKL
jgi:hypothetical protein